MLLFIVVAMIIQLVAIDTVYAQKLIKQSPK